MGGLTSVQVSDFDLSQSTDESIIFNLIASMDNPSAVSVYVGAANFIVIFYFIVIFLLFKFSF